MRIFSLSGSSVRGEAAERAAEQWLNGQGLSSVARNFRCKAGEIDLVMRDGGQLVFVEVRLRSRLSHGGATESVTRAKQRRIIRAAEAFLLGEPRWRQLPCRFDVLAAQPRAEGGSVEWQWLRAAFVADT